MNTQKIFLRGLFNELIQKQLVRDPNLTRFQKHIINNIEKIKELTAKRKKIKQKKTNRKRMLLQIYRKRNKRIKYNLSKAKQYCTNCK